MDEFDETCANRVNWQGILGAILKWVIDEALKHGLVAKEHVELIALTDDPYEGFCLIRDACKVK